MQHLVLTVIGDDRPGLVSALADVVAANGGNWERSQLAQLEGKFAGIVVVGVTEDDADGLLAATRAIDDLDVAVHAASGIPVVDDETVTHLTIGVLGNDRPGIVRELSTVLGSHGLSIENMTTGTREAPMAGGLLFEAHFDVRVPAGTDLVDVRTELERLAAELLVDLGIDEG
ncbi:ACT domain-containing protein [Gordonia sp. X0973]|uniref:glycine cleavage system protein R n=1 Tax=Gordonia sp. X0973 TaxID=2742602 RepID=UPI000F532B46|nr:ACT domain-containing protein [Gordonia sp. X0973]QKT06737.1 ACT domain-containing protein [Gordonia sp. X0973]